MTRVTSKLTKLHNDHTRTPCHLENV